MYVCMYIFVYVCMCVYIYIYMYIYICVYIYTYTCTCTYTTVGAGGRVASSFGGADRGDIGNSLCRQRWPVRLLMWLPRPDQYLGRLRPTEISHTPLEREMSS